MKRHKVDHRKKQKQKQKERMYAREVDEALLYVALI